MPYLRLDEGLQTTIWATDKMKGYYDDKEAMTGFETDKILKKLEEDIEKLKEDERKSK